MNLKRTLVAVFAAGTMILSAAAGFSAHPNHEHANCVAHIAHHDGGQGAAVLAQAGAVSGQATGSDTCQHLHTE